jgi:hypothetical protein
MTVPEEDQFRAARQRFSDSTAIQTAAAQASGRAAKIAAVERGIRRAATERRLGVARGMGFMALLIALAGFGLLFGSIMKPRIVEVVGFAQVIIGGAGLLLVGFKARGLAAYGQIAGYALVSGSASLAGLLFLALHPGGWGLGLCLIAAVIGWVALVIRNLARRRLGEIEEDERAAALAAERAAAGG